MYIKKIEANCVFLYFISKYSDMICTISRRNKFLKIISVFPRCENKIKIPHESLFSRYLISETSEDAEHRRLAAAFRQRERLLLPLPAVTTEAQRSAAGPRLLQNWK